MLLKSIFDYDTTYVVFAGLTIILCAVYMLRMFQFSMLGEAQEDNKPMALINTLPLMVIAVLVIVVGIFPQWFIEIFEPAVKNILTTISNTKGVMS
jgi:NADH-quinone oxidoreductase subunit M